MARQLVRSKCSFGQAAIPAKARWEALNYQQGSDIVELTFVGRGQIVAF